MIKTGHENDMTDHIGALYIEKKTELSWTIEWGAVCNETKQDNDAIDSIGLVYVENKTEVSWLIRLGTVCDKTGQDNDMIDSIVYAKNEIELLWLVGLGALCYKNQIVQWRDRFYKTTMWQIIKVRSMLKMIWSFHDRSDWVPSVIKTR